MSDSNKLPPDIVADMAITARRMGAASRARAARFSWDAAAERYLEMFAELMAHVPLLYRWEETPSDQAMPYSASIGSVLLPNRPPSVQRCRQRHNTTEHSVNCPPAL